MSTMAILQALESDLSQSLQYENTKDEAATKVTEYFIAQKGVEPSDTQMLHHFLQKFYSKTGIDTSNLSSYSKNFLKEAFYESISAGLFARYRQQTVDANSAFAKANLIATHLNKAFMTDYFGFAVALDADPLQKKLKAEKCYELTNQTLTGNKDQGVAMIGAGLDLAIEIGDEKRRLDFLSKCQYVLYEMESLQHVAMSLGHYLLAGTATYETLRAWTQFHIGNIWLDFQNATAAKDEFEGAMDWALADGFDYAVMTLSERLGLANMRLGKLSLAEKNYEDSRTRAKSDQIKPEQAMKNEVRCLIGLGNLYYRKAETQSGDQRDTTCIDADQIFKQAVNLTNQVTYPTNKRVAFVNLSELYKMWKGPGDPDVNNFLELANQ